MKKVISIVGARPNFMKVAPLHRAFQSYKDDIIHMIVHTGQHYDVNMSDAFFKDLEMPQPDYFLGIGSGSHAEQTAKIMIEFEKICLEQNPDLVIVVGDVNSTIACALTAVKCGIKVAHVEAGLRSFDRDMPEEINRMATDAICDYCFVTEKSAVENLIISGFPEKNIFFTGNTMIDSQVYALPKAEKSDKMSELDLSKGEYTLATIHRPSNVDESNQLRELLDVFSFLSKFRKIVLPVHPRTLKNIKSFGFEDIVNSIDGLILTEPMGYIDFLSLMMNSDFVLTDSGGIQEETTALSIPCLTIRTTTERPVTIEEGSNILVKPEKDEIIKAIKDILKGDRKKSVLPKFWDAKAGERIASIINDLMK